ncbi:MAG TPA: bifunctional phosphoribosyl-AMP cyclohydrolase/phosphoribosyl-ATP diphosphatase HisIE [Candidatus Limnocylindria bacterium]|nr:bifunctional phosphoribosyl-AMP cyclohydrolase/phosphoribosyl-ATP diphosphatase HisIE [Candidatus Limnocylindria bacterium]
MAWLSDRRPDWARGALLPVVVTDAGDGTLLMLAWANAAAVAATEATGQAHFWSRSRDELWRKGATSGHTMEIVSMAADCDADAIHYRVRPAGPACHTGTRSCFEDEPRFDLTALAGVIAARRAADPETSYTARLLAGGARRPAEKVTEEAGELSAAALAGSDDEVVGEAADLLYHALVLLEARGIPLADVEAELERRHLSG